VRLSAFAVSARVAAAMATATANGKVAGPAPRSRNRFSDVRPDVRQCKSRSSGSPVTILGGAAPPGLRAGPRIGARTGPASRRRDVDSTDLGTARRRRRTDGDQRKWCCAEERARGVMGSDTAAFCALYLASRSEGVAVNRNSARAFAHLTNRIRRRTRRPGL